MSEMDKGVFNNKIVYYALIIILLVGAIFGSIIIKKFIGYAGVEVPAEAGTITTIIIDDRQATLYWHGMYGLVFSESGFGEEQSSTLNPGELSAETFVFDCVDPNQDYQEFYAALNDSIDFANLKAGTLDMIDVDYFNISNNSVDRANNTFTENISILLGGTNISNIPGVYTYVNDGPDNSLTFFTGILNNSGYLALVARLYTSSQTSFKGTSVRYQMLLPVPNASTKYYFFADPNDECPAGFGTGQVGDAQIEGYVFISNTSTPLPNVTVSAGGNTTLTNSNGLFNMTVPGGRSYNLVAIKEGYITNITSVNTSIGQTTKQNLTMAIFYGFRGPNGTISGYVRDNSSGAVIENVTISIAGLVTLSNASGNYSFDVERGTHVIAAVKSGYSNFIGNFTISAFQNMSFYINMSSVTEAQDLNGTLLSNGTIQGYVTDNSTNTSLVNVSVTVAGESSLTNGSGFYNLTTYEGTTNLVATKSGYNAFYHEVNISSTNITEYNFNMSIVITPSVGNGTVRGFVRNTLGNPIEGVAVSIAGKTNLSNSTGEYVINGVPAVTHSIIATRSGFENHVAEVNITAGETTEHNIIMITVNEAGLGTGQGTGQGSGQGAGLGAGEGTGKGTGTGVQAQIEQPTEIKEYELSVKQIIKKIRKGNFITTPITITNNKDDSIDVRFSVEGGVREMVRMDKERLIINGNSQGEVMLTILGNVEPGVYEGNFVISGDIEVKIPIYVLVLDKDRLDVEALVIKIIPEKKKVAAGSDFKFRVDLQNLLSDEQYRVDLSYSIEGINNNRSIFIEKENIVILTSFSLLKSVRLPPDLKNGDYKLKVQADFLELTSEASTIFTVREPIYKYALFGVIPLWIVLILVGIISTGTFAALVYRKKKAEKQRYQIEIDYANLPKAGPRSAYVGNVAETKNKAYFDLDVFQVHTLVAGASGSGKSIVAQDLVEEALLKGASVIVFDPTAQWTGFLRRCQDKNILGMYPKFGMKKTDARAFNGNIYRVDNPREAIDFMKIMKPSEINVFVTSKLETKNIELFVANTIREIFHSNLPESKELKYLLVYDGIHSLLPKFGGSGQVFVQIERATREFRKWGVGLILISQVISDFPPEVLANINTEIQMRTRDEGDLNRTKEEYGEKMLKSVVKAAVGTGMVENSSYNKGKPYFVAFRPMMHNSQRVSDKELENYNKYNKIVDDLDYQLEQLEKDGIDIFDLRLELKLAQDKVKSGSFNMVDIYLDGLKPRIKAQWDKLGKQPKKREIKYVSEVELKDELEKAKKERKKTDEGDAEENSGKTRGANEEENTSDVIRKAKEAKEAEKNKEEVKNGAEKEPVADNKTEEKEQAKENEAEEDIDSIVKNLHSHIDSGDKKMLAATYSKLQSIYKTSSKEDKIKILQECNLIRQKLSKK